MKQLTASEMQRRSVDKQKEKYGDSYKEEMARRGKKGGRPKEKLDNLTEKKPN